MPRSSPAAGSTVTGIDFSPASIRHARALCQDLPCEFIQGDVRAMDFAGQGLDAAIYLYGQFTVLTPAESLDVLKRIRAALRPGGKLLLEILDDDKFDKKDNTWWYTDTGGLWGDFPYLHLGERSWDPAQRAAVERFHILNLETGEMQVYGLSDQAYTAAQVTAMLQEAGFERGERPPGVGWSGAEGCAGVGGVCGGDDSKMADGKWQDSDRLAAMRLTDLLNHPPPDPPTPLPVSPHPRTPGRIVATTALGGRLPSGAGGCRR